MSKTAIQRFIATVFLLCLSSVSLAGVKQKPTTLLSGYWQNFTNPAETPVRLIDIPKGYRNVIIAFADMSTDGSVSFNLQGPPYDSMENGDTYFKNDIKTIQQNGTHVLISLGGQNGYYQVDTPAKEAKFIETLSAIIKNYGFDGVDYDFESGLSLANSSYLLDATRRLKNQFATEGKSLLVTMAPETIDVYWQVFPNGKYDTLIQSGLVDFIQVQLYNSGCMAGINPGSQCYSQGTEDFIVSQADSTIQTWMQHGIPDAASKYMLGLPATQQAAGGGYVDPTVLNNSIACLKSNTHCNTYVPTRTYPDIGGIMTWSINWDAKNSYNFVNNVINHSN